MAAALKVVKGSNPPITVQLYPVDSDTGSNGIDLTGATEVAAKAELADGSGSAIAFTGASVPAPATDGKVKLEYATDTFTALGVYRIVVTYTDGAGAVHKYPSDGTSLQFELVEDVE